MSNRSCLQNASLIGLISLWSASISAQTYDSFYLKITHIFQYIETSRVNTGLLKDYGIDFADVINFDGVQLSDTNVIYSNIWNDLYTSLYSYRFSSSAPSMPNPDTVFSNMMSRKTSGYVPLSLLLFQYTKLRDDAYTNNLITITGDQLFDKYVSGVWQNPYEQRNIFAVTTNKDFFTNGNINFRLPSSLMFTNFNNIQTIQADFADGQGWRTIVPDVSFNVSYADTGLKIMNFRVTLTNNQQMNCRAGIGVYFQTGSNQRMLNAQGFFEHRDIPIAANGVHSGGTLQIHYSVANAATQRLTRPLIIAEGFDPWKLISNDPDDNLDFDYVWLQNERGIYGQTLQGLLEDNYDIVYIDYNDGTDAIERNASLVVDAINIVNGLKADAGSNEPNVIIGFSMGGLVARYALRQMELNPNGPQHQARLFISYDAPYLGANVPLGLQAFDTHIANTKIKIGLMNGTIGYVTTGGAFIRALTVYNTPGAQELLKYYLRINSSGTIYMDNSVHDNLVSALSAMGYPQLTRNIAVANGSECATQLPLQPGSDFVRFSGHYNTTFLGSALFSTIGLLAGSYTNFPQFLLGIIPGRNDIKCTFIVRTTPASGTLQVYYGKISYVKKILWVININTTLSSNSYVSPSGVLPLDAYPGGQYAENQVAQIIQKDFSGNFGTSFWQQLINTLLKRGVDEYYLASSTFTFTPTPHVLDIGQGNTALINTDYTTRYEASSPPAPPKNTPFTNFITAYFNGSSNNEEHIQIESREGDWIADELNGTVVIANCAFLCNTGNITVTGPSPLCNTPLVYYLNNAPAGTTRTWSATPIGIVTIAPSPDGTQATVTRISSGYFVLQVAISNVCGSVTVSSSSIRAGGFSSPDYPISGPSSACKNQYLTFTTNTLPGATNYNWTWSTSNLNYSSGQGTPSLTLRTGTTTGTGTVTLRVANACDAGGSPAVKFIQINNCGFSFTISPNPSSGNLTVSTQNQSEAGVQPEKIYQIKVVDQMGKIRKQFNYSGGLTTIALDLSSLGTGIYTMQVYNGAEWSSQQFVKQ